MIMLGFPRTSNNSIIVVQHQYEKKTVINFPNQPKVKFHGSQIFNFKMIAGFNFKMIAQYLKYVKTILSFLNFPGIKTHEV